jgi:polyferredoxin
MRYDLTKSLFIKRILRNRWPQFVLTTIALAGFVLAILSGFFGTPVGSRNFGIIFVWIAWWAILMLAAVPLLGRAWCSICPIPAPGEWMQRGALMGPGQNMGIGLRRRWPRKLRNIWLQNSTFLLVALFSTLVLTQPRLTAVVLSAFLFVALGISLVFERRAFCRYLCPVGGFIGLYSQLAPVEVRVKDRAVCASHTEKTCYTGSASGPSVGYGCPWDVFPGGLVKNTYCGACMECLRTCPYDNIAIQLRPFGADLSQKGGRKLDEAFKAFIMLGSALIYGLVLLGPWGMLKNAAYSIGSPAWLGYALVFLVIIVGVLPGIFWLCVRLGQSLARWRASKSTASTRHTFTTLAYAMLPLGMAAWIAFSLAFVFTNLSYVWTVLSDPFGWGWNLFGATNTTWTPYLGGIIPYLQGIVLLIGLVWSVLAACRLAEEIQPKGGAAWQATPVIAYCLLIALALLGVFVA